MKRSLSAVLAVVSLAACPSPSSSSGKIVDTANSITHTNGLARTDPEGVAPDAPHTDVVTWRDGRGADRTLTLYAYLYEYAFSFLGGAPDPSQVTTRTANDSAYGHEGFGYVVSHNLANGNSPLGKANAPTKVETRVFKGGHHALHHIELIYDRDKEGGGNGIRVPVIIEWVVATGRDHPIWAATWKGSQIENPLPTNLNVYRMDTRGPYGSLNWDGAASRDAGDAIGGVSWGDFALRFQTTDAQLTLGSPWTYNTPNTTVFARAWTAAVNAEMGIVETRPGDKQLGYPDRVVGRERGATSAQAYLGKGDCNAFGPDARVYSVPCVNGWPYQLMNYDWSPGSGKAASEPTGTKLMALGSPYGFIGASDADLFDFSSTYNATGDRSYSTFVVLGPKCRYSAGGGCDQDGDVETTLKAVDALSAATVSDVVSGSLVVAAPVGPGSAQTQNLSNGYDPSYAVHRFLAVANRVTFTFTPAAGKPVKNPIFLIGEYRSDALPKVHAADAELTVNSGDADYSQAFASVDEDGHALWLTLNRTLTEATTVVVSAD